MNRKASIPNAVLLAQVANVLVAQALLFDMEEKERKKVKKRNSAKRRK